MQQQENRIGPVLYLPLPSPDQSEQVTSTHFLPFPASWPAGPTEAASLAKRKVKEELAFAFLSAPDASPLIFPGRSSANTLSHVQTHKDTHTLEEERVRGRASRARTHLRQWLLPGTPGFLAGAIPLISFKSPHKVCLP